MSLVIFKISFHRPTMEQLAKHKDKGFILQTHNKSKIMQLGEHYVRRIHKNKDMLCRFFVVPGGCPAL